MIKFKQFVLFVAIGSFLTVQGQETTYYSGFDNAAEQAGWAEYKLGATEFNSWEFNTFEPYSPTTSIHHDYSPSTGVEVKDDWFVSPGFSITEGGALDSIRCKFTGFSVPEVGDTIGLYLLLGNQNPELASSKILLFDFRGIDYETSSFYFLLEDRSFPASDETGYFAIRYLNANASEKWLTVSFDNVAITARGTVGLPEDVSTGFSVFPNPSSGLFTLQSTGKLERIEVFDVTGTRVYVNDQLSSQLSQQLNLSELPRGIYFIKVIMNGLPRTRKLVLK